MYDPFDLGPGEEIPLDDDDDEVFAHYRELYTREKQSDCFDCVQLTDVPY